MGTILRDALRICDRDLRDFFRDRMRIISFALMPIFMMVMTGYIFPSENSLKEIPLALVDQDRGELGSTFAKMLTRFSSGKKPMFKLRTVGDPVAARELIKKGEVDGAVVLPPGLSQTVRSGGQGTVTILTDQANPQISTMLQGVLAEGVRQLGTRLATLQVGTVLANAMVPKTPPQKGLAPSDEQSRQLGTKSPVLRYPTAMTLSEPTSPLRLAVSPQALVQPLLVKNAGIVPGKPNYFQFMAPGIMAMVVVMAVMMGLAGAISREKEIGTLDGLLIAPIHRVSIILGKAFSQSVRGLLQGLLVLLLAIFLFHVKIYGSVLLMVFLLLLGIFSFVGLGILISAFASEQETAMTLMMMLNFPMMFLSGAFFPIEQMPRFMQAISRVIPLTYVIDGLRKVIILGAEVSALTTEILVLAGFGLVMLVIAVPTFNRIVTR